MTARLGAGGGGGFRLGLPGVDPRSVRGFWGWWNVGTLRKFGGAGSVITGWPDVAGLRNLVATGTQPSLQYSAVDGGLELFLQRSQPQLDWTADGDLIGAWAMLAVVRSGQIAGHDTQVLLDSVAGPNANTLYGNGPNWRLDREPPSYPTGEVQSSNTRTAFNPADSSHLPPNTPYQLLTAIMSTTQNILRVNGVQVALAVANTPTLSGGLRIGNVRAGSTTSGFEAAVREIVFYRGFDYAPAELRPIEQALVDKHHVLNYTP